MQRTSRQNEKVRSKTEQKQKVEIMEHLVILLIIVGVVDVVISTISHVHKLQHAFTLCGVSKKIVL